MRRTHLLFTLIFIAGCTAQVSDLDDLQVDDDACQNTGSATRGTDLNLQLVGVTPHVNQDMFFAVTVGEDANIEGLFVLSTLDDANLNLVIPKMLPEGPSDLAFWADSEPLGVFNSIPDMDESGAIDHQWKRPICPNGQLTFTHTTPFQDVQDAVSTGAIFHFIIPEALRRVDGEGRPVLFDNFTMWVIATQLDDNDQSEEVQTRAYFRWSPFVDDEQTRPAPMQFQVGGNALGQMRGPIDKRSFYNIEFVIDVDGDGERGNRDYICRYERERAPDTMDWNFEPNLAECDVPSGFDPFTFEP
jgi:hypothetical protein